MVIHDLLPWGPPTTELTRDGFRIVRRARPTQSFWTLYKQNKDALRLIGITVGKEGEQWVVRWATEDDWTQLSTEASRAVDAQIDIPARNGFSYLPFQRAGIAFVRNRRGALIGDPCGAGKSIEALGFINVTPEIKRVLIVCPAIMKINWQMEATRWLVDQFDIRILYGTKPQGIATQGPAVIICNYTILPHWRDALREFAPDLVIADESTAVKNPKAKCSKALFSIPAKYRLALSGTPIMNRPAEIWSVLSWLNPVMYPPKEFFSFARLFCGSRRIKIGKNKWAWDHSGASNLTELQARLRSGIMLRRAKEAILPQLPPKVHQVIEFPSNGSASIVTQETEKWRQLQIARKQLMEAKTSGMSSALRLADLQDRVRVLFTEMSEIRHMTALAKLPSVIEHLETCLESGAKILCFGHHRDCIEKIHEHFGVAAAKLYGGDSDADRQNAVDRFQTDPTCMLMVAGLKAAGMGLTLTASSHVVLSELDWTPAVMEQAIDRCHRIGQSASSVFIQYLVLEGSLDARVARIMTGKEENINAALDALPDMSEEN